MCNVSWTRTLNNQTLWWVLPLRPVLCLCVPSFQGVCSNFGLILLFSLCTGMALATFDGWLNMKTLGCILWGSCEAVSQPSPTYFSSMSQDWQWRRDRWSCKPQHSKCNSPLLTTSREVLSSYWMSFRELAILRLRVLPITLSYIQVNESSNLLSVLNGQHWSYTDLYILGNIFIMVLNWWQLKSHLRLKLFPEICISRFRLRRGLLEIG